MAFDKLHEGIRGFAKDGECGLSSGTRRSHPLVTLTVVPVLTLRPSPQGPPQEQAPVNHSPTLIVITCERVLVSDVFDLRDHVGSACMNACVVGFAMHFVKSTAITAIVAGCATVALPLVRLEESYMMGRRCFAVPAVWIRTAVNRS